MIVRRLHQLLGLGAGAIWLVQVLTGVVLTFRQEIDHVLVGGTDAQLDVVALDRRIGSIVANGGNVTSIWVANFAATRFDVRYSDRFQARRRMQVDGASRILRDGSADSRFANGGFFETLTDIHATLLAGHWGRWLIICSGVLLLSNVVLGLKLAWPRKGYWRQGFVWRAGRNRIANYHGLHRTLGLYIAIPLLVLVSAGIALCFEDRLQVALNATREAPVSDGPATEVHITPARALSVALARFPGATLTALSMPGRDAPWYRVRLRVPGEVPRTHGQTAIYLSVADGAILREYVAPAAPTARLALDWVYPIHTMEAGGVVGRALLVGTGVSLLTLGFLGIRLWSLRRAGKRRKRGVL